jgi:inner membrane protein
MAGANFPDIDVLAYFVGPGADLEWRRGWTHGILALLVLPFVLTGSLLLVHRLSWVRRRTQPAPLVPKQLLLLSSIAILSHPLLDTLNTYGVRWLMPFSGRWFYGDTLFILDPWVWIALALGVYFAKWRRPGGSRPARLALAAVLIYTVTMTISGWAAGKLIAREVALLSAKPARSVMAGPAPIDPFVRRFVVKQDQEYWVGTFRWLPRPHVDRHDVLTYPRDRPPHSAFDAAVLTRHARRFLGWARFPTFSVDTVAAGEYLVHLVDLRYARGPGESFGALSIPVTLPTASALPPSTPPPAYASF